MQKTLPYKNRYDCARKGSKKIVGRAKDLYGLCPPLSINIFLLLSNKISKLQFEHFIFESKTFISLRVLLLSPIRYERHKRRDQKVIS